MSDYTKISSRIIGASGEYHVMHQILRRGYLAALAPDGAPNSDIIVTDIFSEKLCSIQVKTRRDIGSDKGWHMKEKHEELISDNLFYCFVDLGSEFSDVVKTYIIPSKIVAYMVKTSHQIWFKTPGAKGQKRNETKMRRMLPDYSKLTNGEKTDLNMSLGWMDEYLENWDLITNQ